MSAEAINKKLKELYEKNMGIFENIPKFSDDYTYPTLMKCTDEWADKKYKKILFVDTESVYWFRDRKKDFDNIIPQYEARAPWVYDSKFKAEVDGYMDMYQYFCDNILHSNILSKMPKNKTAFWQCINNITNAVSNSEPVISMFSYYYKADVNSRNKRINPFAPQRDPKVVYNENKMMLKYQDDSISLLSKEIKLLKPDLVIHLANDGNGNGLALMKLAFGQNVSLIPLSDHKGISYICQTQLPKSRMFLLPVPSNTLLNNDIAKVINALLNSTNHSKYVSEH